MSLVGASYIVARDFKNDNVSVNHEPRVNVSTIAAAWV